MLGVPDGTGPADPQLSASNVFINNQWHSIGGTSAVSPIKTGLALRIHELIQPKKIGFIHPVLYPKETTAFYDITTGTNGSFAAQPLYDLASGLGTMIGVQWLAAFQAEGAPVARFSPDNSIGKSPLVVTFINGSTGIPTSWDWDFGFVDPLTGKQATSTQQNPSCIFVLPEGKTTADFNVILRVANSFGESSVMHIVTVNNDSGSSFPVWAIVVITIVALLILVLGVYFGVKHQQDIKSGKISSKTKSPRASK